MNMLVAKILPVRCTSTINSLRTERILQYVAKRNTCTTQKRFGHPVSNLSSWCLRLRHMTCKNGRNNTLSVLSKLKYTLSGSCGYWLMTFKFSKTADCTPKVKHSRIVQKEDGEPDANFDWKEFANILWPDIWYLLAAIISSLAAAMVNIQIPLLLGDVVNVVSKLTKENVSDFISEIKKPAIKLLAYYSIQGLLTFSYISLLSTVGENVAARLRVRLFESLLRQDVQFFDTHKTGELIDRLTSDIQDFKSSFKLVISQGLRASAQTIGCVFTLYTISPKLTGLMVTVIPAIIVVGSFMGSGLRSLSKAAQAQVSQSTAVADEAIGNVRTVRAFAMETKENEIFSQEVEESRRLNIKLGVGIGLFQGLSNVVLNGIVLGTLFTGGYLMSSHEISAGDLMSFLVASQTIERSLAQMSMLFGNVVKGMSAGARVFEFINEEPSIPLTGGKSIPYHSLNGDIKFDNVTFSYPTRKDQVVLRDFNLSIPGGKVVALVGLSGGGKSTVAGLLERFYDISCGKITIDGKDLKDLDPTWLRGKAIGFINQEPVLFATSIMENIRYGRPNATDTEVLEAAVMANAHEFIMSFPKGYKTVLGERGVTVSGGQKQRIAIARALIKDPSILILDEATSALDAESEKIVQDALDNVVKGRTVLIIAHRLSTIRDADIIAVVSNGQIVEQGTHETLKKKKGLYWELIRKQELDEEIEEYQRSHYDRFNM